MQFKELLTKKPAVDHKSKERRLKLEIILQRAILAVKNWNAETRFNCETSPVVILFVLRFSWF